MKEYNKYIFLIKIILLIIKISLFLLLIKNKDRCQMVCTFDLLPNDKLLINYFNFYSS